MTKRERIRKELVELCSEGYALAGKFNDDETKDFRGGYQTWYSKAVKAVGALAPDRHVEFKGYYEIDPKRKSLGYGTYVIQDFMKGVSPGSWDGDDTKSRVLTCFINQLTILKSLEHRIDSVISNIESELYAELQDGELVIATQLAKISPRAAGALMGVVIEGHLQKVANAHAIKIAKKHPTIADLNEPLKAAGVIDIAVWRKISFLADLRNLCSHKKDVEPTKEQAEELIQGAEWLTKNIF
ncbi:hypothetical protein SAMN04487857_11864 [Pseudomonas sp. ok272]|uniref:hypothetical protein n=1 Tax=unclassified Pseudomonas TaxID=196821 RepID=UPI0008C083B0|nr:MULTISPECIES: hypothetical protein [unclassified Pseudomonas]SEN48554.1 hypothetical protein SAMN04487857_11864 [Pseudomonas sp. ok272]SFN27687.1 hypothetical protein SAMN04487858_1177 [Pseudomonas sp. ok602]